jgi:ribosomal protein S18 acetylase RimI-like enzyme
MSSTIESINIEIRPFAGSIDDAAGIIQVDRETFDDCPYSPDEIAALQAAGTVQAWMAVLDEQIVGFVSAFETHSLAGRQWEIDELAVRPSTQQQGLGTRLVAAAVAGMPCHPLPDRARAVVAQRNTPSARTFVRNGFTPQATVDLLLYEVSGRAPRPATAGPQVGLASPAKVATLTGHPASYAAKLQQETDNLYLVALENQHPLGCVELVRVRTFQYEGYWLESIALAVRRNEVARALFAAAIEQAKADPAVDRLGYLAAADDRLIYTACVSQGFHVIDTYQVFTRRPIS